MRFRLVLRVMLILLAAACGAKPHGELTYKADVDRVLAEHPKSNNQIPAPATLDPNPWKVGQWALYLSRRSNGDDLSVERISVVAQDGCGFWIESESYSNRLHLKWRMCLQSGDVKTSALELLQKFEVQNGRDTVPTTIDFRNENARRRRDLEGFVEGLLPTRIAADAKLDREDVEVPAGHFAQVIRETHKLDDGGQATRWFSPEIPFAGTIKRRTTEWEFLLLAYGSNADTHEPTPTTAHDTPTVSP